MTKLCSKDNMNKLYSKDMNKPSSKSKKDMNKLGTKDIRDMTTATNCASTIRRCRNCCWRIYGDVGEAPRCSCDLELIYAGTSVCKGLMVK